MVGFVVLETRSWSRHGWFGAADQEPAPARRGRKEDRSQVLQQRMVRGNVHVKETDFGARRYTRVCRTRAGLVLERHAEDLVPAKETDT